METRRVAGLSFNLLAPEEERKHTKDCEHAFAPHNKEVIVNPAMEYVQGYGCEFVSVLIAEGKLCKKCGAFFLTKDNRGLTSQGGIERILTHRSHRRTICQLLRELHDAADEKDRPKLEQALLMAKRMNDKLVEYCGRGYESAWYNEMGEYHG